MLEHPHEPVNRTLGFDPESSTARVVENLSIYGHTLEYGEPEYRLMPDAKDLAHLSTALFSAITGTLEGTALEPELPSILWSLTDAVSRQAVRMRRQIDDNEVRQKALVAEQDGSEVKDVELQRVLQDGHLKQDKEAGFENWRDSLAEEFEQYTGSPWRPRAGSMVNHRNLTATVVDARESMAARRRNESELLIPKGTMVAFSGGLNCTDQKGIYAALDAQLAQHPDMYLAHTGAQTGADRIAACWAANRKIVTQPFKPDWTRDGRGAPFKRNDRLLLLLPKAVVVFPGNGITDGFARKAGELRLNIVDHRKGA